MITATDFNGDEVKLKLWKFPAGELGVRILDYFHEAEVTIECIWQSSDDLIYLLLLVDAIRQNNSNTLINLNIPYFPYARQDRVCAIGESFSLKVIANLINTCNFNSISVQDAHSSVLSAFFDAGILVDTKQYELVYPYVKDRKNAVLISPDNGATKKIFILSKFTAFPVVEAQKVRDVNTGNIIETKIESNDLIKDAEELIVVDDICDGGRTFVELAKVIRKNYFKKLTLIVTHGIFSNGFDELNKYYDEIIYINNLQKGNQ